MASCAIVAAADFNELHFRQLDGQGAFDSVIAVDGGYAHLQAICREADMVVGDFDSLGYVPSHPRVQLHNPRKDASDLELALDTALEQGFDIIYVYGCLSGRLDHTVAALHQLARASERGAAVTGVGDAFAVRALAGPDSFVIPGSSGGAGCGAMGTVSVFAACDEAKGVSESGLEYPLENAVLSNRISLGLSNELRGVEASVSVEKGTIYVFFPLCPCA